MKKEQKTKIFSIVLLITIILFIYRSPVYAENTDDIQGDIQNEIEKLIPDEYAELFDFSDGLSSETISGIDGGFFIKFIITLISSSLGDNLSFLAVFVSIASICGIFKCFSDSMSKSLNSAFSYTVSIVSAVIFVKLLSGIFSEIISSIDKISLFIGKFTPIICSVALIAGNVGTAAVASSHFSLIMSIMQTLSAEILSPLLRICLLITVISSLSRKKELSSLSSHLCKTFTWGVGMIMLVITTVFTFQTSISSGADSLALRTARLASGAIPVVGSAVSQASGTLLGSLSVIKNVCGGIGILIVMLIFLPPLIKFIMTKTLLSLCSALADSFSCGELSGLLKSASDLLGYGIAIYVISDITIIISTSLLMMISL